MVPLTSQPSRRPRAFGRSSNVWQYVGLMQERKTPKSLSRQKEQEDVREASLCSLDSGYDDDDEIIKECEGYGEADDEHTRPSKTAAAALQIETISDINAHGAAMKNSMSLPELPAWTGPSNHVNGTQAIKLGTLTGLKKGSVAQMAASRQLLTVSNNNTSSKRHARAGVVNSHDVIKRILALSTSASVPVMAPMENSNTTNRPTSGGGGASSSLRQQQVHGVTQQAAGLSNTISGVPIGGTAVQSMTSVSALSDADKLRNDFNSQRSRLYYGCSIALELFNGHLLMVGSPDGQVRVQSLEKLQAAPQIKGCKDRVHFTLIDLTDVRSANTIRYGDAVWLQLSVGAGEVSWEQGGVLGAQVREAPQLKALALAKGDVIRNSAQAPAIIGHPVPIKAYLPKSRDDGDTQVDEIQSRVRNKASKMLGKWIIRSAVLSQEKQKDNFVYNTDEIYLEQDWFYLGADSDAGVAVLRQLPLASSLKDVKPGEYVIERRAAWRIRLLDSSNGGSGLSLAQQQMERLLLRAKMQIKQSKKMRAGQVRCYQPDLQGGSQFITQLRAQMALSTRECDEKYRDGQLRRLKRLESHLVEKAEAMNLMGSTDDAEEEKTCEAISSIADRTSNESSASLTQRGGVKSAFSKQNENDNGQKSAEKAQSTEDSLGCSLCHSSTIGYNLCCQTHLVMQTLHAENELREVAMLHTVSKNQSNNSPHSRATTHRGALKSSKSTSRSTHTGRTGVATPSPSNENHNLGIDNHDAAQQRTLTTPQDEIHAREQERILQLFAYQDQQMLDIIKFKEKEVRDALAAKEQARMGLSPVATHFRDRFKHVGLLAQAHLHGVHGGAQPSQQHGIGGHFQKLHAELYGNSRDRTFFVATHVQQYLQDYGQDVATFTIDTTTTCPLEFPREDSLDVYGHVNDSDVSDPTPRNRLFPTPTEMDLVPPIDTKKSLELYLQNRLALLEMLDGYTELVETQMRPKLLHAVETRNRGALVEILDFTAKASEFVGANRVQVAVAQLLHAIHVSDVGDFETFADAVTHLLAEFVGTTSFIKFYREGMRSKQKKKYGAGERYVHASTQRAR